MANLRLQTGGSHAMAGVPVTLYTVPANQNLYLDYLTMTSLAALAAGDTIIMEADGNIIATITPAGPLIAVSFVRPIIAANSITAQGVAGTLEWAIAGDVR